ncbi:MAG: DUF3794 domain-containing protein [Clostridia bacterium]|nr:DUF3794 domain-containing protein [Clostridia bacterium]
MEEKCVKTPIFTFDTVFKDSAEVPIDIDFNLPDYCPEISRILKCRAKARVSSASADEQRISSDGVVTVTLIYADDENRINSYEYQYPFSKSFESTTDISGAFIKARVRCEYINCRAVTERKVDIHGALGLSVTASMKKSRDIISDIDDINIEVLRTLTPATTPIGYASKYVIIEDEIEIGSSMPDIKCLIRYDAAIKTGECKLLADKAIVKGELIVSLAYRDDDGEIQQLEESVPFSQLLEIEGVTEECECQISADIAFLEIKPKFNSSSDSRSFSLGGKVLLQAEAYCQGDVEVVTDAYSRLYEADVSGEDVYLNRLVCTINDTFNCRKEIEFPAGSITKVCDIKSEAKVDSTNFKGDCLIVSGTAVCDILAADETGAVAYYEKPVEFEYRYKLSVEGENFTADPQVSVLSVGYTISGDIKMEIRLQMSLSAAVYKQNRVPVVSDIQVNESRPIEKRNRGALTIYFAESGENIWGVARKYLADIDEVRRLNELSDDTLTGGQMLLIPVK